MTERSVFFFGQQRWGRGRQVSVRVRKRRSRVDDDDDVILKTSDSFCYVMSLARRLIVERTYVHNCTYR